MKRNKGFTLVELLAVIVILAVIALIATPTVLNMIEEARVGAAESSMYSYVDQMEKQIVIKMMDDSSANYDGTYTLAGTKATKDGDATITFDLDIKNDQPKAGATNTITVSNGNVTDAQLTFGKYAVVYDFNAASGKSKVCAGETYATDCIAGS